MALARFYNCCKCKRLLSKTKFTRFSSTRGGGAFNMLICRQCWGEKSRIQKMQKLIEPNTVPPDGYRYRQAETRTWIRAPDYHNLFVQVAEHRKANNLPLGTFWEAEVEDQLCQALPPGQCKQSIPGQGRNVFTRIGWDDVVAGTRTLTSWAGQGFPKVDQTLADTRANICSRCYFNVQMQGGCGSCGQVANLAMGFIGTRRTSSDPFLKACAVCKCSLQVKVWTPIDAIDKGTSQAQYDRFPLFCWVKSELDTYRSKQLSPEPAGKPE